MTIEYLKKIGFVQRPQCLANFVVIDKNKLEAGRIEKVPLSANAQITTSLVNYPKLISLFAKDSRQ
jgi:hypothetical protein